MTNEIEEKHEELEDCKFCGIKENCNNYYLGYRKAGSELFHERQKLQERINIAFNQGKEEARKEFLDKLKLIWGKRRFVTANSASTEIQEQQYRKGYNDCYNNIVRELSKQSLGEKGK